MNSVNGSNNDTILGINKGVCAIKNVVIGTNSPTQLNELIVNGTNTRDANSEESVPHKCTNELAGMCMILTIRCMSPDVSVGKEVESDLPSPSSDQISGDNTVVVNVVNKDSSSANDAVSGIKTSTHSSLETNGKSQCPTLLSICRRYFKCARLVP